MRGSAPNDTNAPVLSADLDHTVFATFRCSPGQAHLASSVLQGCQLELREARGPAQGNTARQSCGSTQGGASQTRECGQEGTPRPRQLASPEGPSTSPSTHPASRAPPWLAHEVGTLSATPAALPPESPHPPVRPGPATPPDFLWPGREGAADKGDPLGHPWGGNAGIKIQTNHIIGAREGSVRNGGRSG